MKLIEQNLVGGQRGAEFGLSFVIEQMAASRYPCFITDYGHGTGIVPESGLRESFRQNDSRVLGVGHVGVPGVKFGDRDGITLLTNRQHARVLFGSGQIPKNKTTEQNEKRQDDES